MTVRETSKIANDQNEASGQNRTVERQIYDYVAENGPVTRRQIAVALGLDTATVSGRVTPLVASGDLQDGEKKPCPITGRLAFQVDIPGGQRALF